jgi:hypothetical protein
MVEAMEAKAVVVRTVTADPASTSQSGHSHWSALAVV